MLTEEQMKIAIWAGVAIVAVAIIYFVLLRRKREGYRDPIFLNKQLYASNIYPRSNGSIYGPFSTILSGFTFYDRAY